MTDKLFVKKLDERATLPKKGSPRSAGYDITACLAPGETIIIKGLKSLMAANPKADISQYCRAVIPTGIAMTPPADTYLRAAPRSGLAAKNGIHVNAGVLDEDYTGAVGVVLVNYGAEDFHVKHGDRIAQIICECIKHPEVVETDELPTTDRGDGGFGSTGQ